MNAAGGFSAPQMIGSCEVDFGASFAGTVVYQLDAGLPITAVGGLHSGCYELKAADFCTAEPETAARRLVDGGFTERYDYALQTVQDVPYDRWHDYDSEDSIRFYALRLREVGMINANPNAILAQGTDWRFVNELKRELKA